MTPPVLMLSLPINYGKILNKVDLLAGTSAPITDASLKRKLPRTSKAESKSDSNSQPGPSKKKARKALSDSDDTSDDSDGDAVNAILGEDEQDGDSTDKLLKEMKRNTTRLTKRAQT